WKMPSGPGISPALLKKWNESGLASLLNPVVFARSLRISALKVRLRNLWPISFQTERAPVWSQFPLLMHQNGRRSLIAGKCCNANLTNVVVLFTYRWQVFALTDRLRHATGDSHHRYRSRPPAH